MPVIRRNVAGKELGMVQHFTSSLGARDIKEKLRASGITGKDLTKRVNETLRGEKDIRQQLATALMQAYFQEGFIPELGSVNKKETRAKIEFVKPVVALKVSELADLTRNQQLAVLKELQRLTGVTAEDIAALKS